jgi:hypothetical protein
MHPTPVNNLLLAGLVKRFGEDHLIYKQNVPRWKPCDGESRQSCHPN